jgi:ectoine hydroxylase-related dioxygenase (phytanoyl-CoA dioxygenase family)
MLSTEQLAHFDEHGYLVVPGAVHPRLCARALRAIYGHMGEHGLETDAFSDVSTLFTEARAAQAAAAVYDVLRRSDAMRAIQALVGSPRLGVHGVDRTMALDEASGPTIRMPQISVVFPRPISDDDQLDEDGESNDASSQSQPRRSLDRPHIDGVSSSPAPEGTPPRTLHSFSLLAGVALTDQPAEWAGNFFVLPGSHRRMSELMRRRAERGLPPGPSGSNSAGGREDDRDDRDGSGDGGVGGDDSGGGGSLDPSVCWPDGHVLPPGSSTWGIEPVQLCLKAGDLVLSHYLTLHGVAPHLGAAPRVNVYWRIKHARHRQGEDDEQGANKGVEEEGAELAVELEAAARAGSLGSWSSSLTDWRRDFDALRERANLGGG